MGQKPEKLPGISRGILATPIGNLAVEGSASFITGVYFTDSTIEDLPVSDLVGEAIQALKSYFSEQTPLPHLPLGLKGQPYTLRVWQTVSQIPPGAISTYGAVAREIGSPQSARAVGQALRKNPIGLFIPCHRVNGSSGNLTGFEWGINRKAWLQAHEKSFPGDQGPGREQGLASK
jgi:methylated-DNA-[protein]-cysteine S-methyltransferase